MKNVKEKVELVLFELLVFVPFLFLKRISSDEKYVGFFVPWLVFSLLAGTVVFYQQIAEINKKDIRNIRIHKNIFSSMMKELLIFSVLYISYVLMLNLFLSKFELINFIIKTDITILSQAFKTETIERKIIITFFLLPLICQFILRRLPSTFIKNKAIFVVVTSIMCSLVVAFNLPHPLLYFLVYFPIAFYMEYRFAKTDNILVTFMFNLIINCSSVIILEF